MQTLADLDSLLYSFVYEMHNHNPLTSIFYMLTLKEKIEKKKRKNSHFFPLVGFLSFFILSLHPQCANCGPSPVGVCILTTMHGFYPFTHTHTHKTKNLWRKRYPEEGESSRKRQYQWWIFSWGRLGKIAQVDPQAGLKLV